MGYPQFGKVRTLTLPIPASDLTNAEYKNTYGIDLASIDFYDLILLKDSDEVIHPVLYADKENKVLYTAELAISYANGFKIVEGESIISKVIATGTIDNAKPLYFHPITIFSIAQKFNFSLVIINNDPTAYNSVSQLKQVIRSWGIPIARVNLNGALKTDSGYLSPSYWTVQGNADYIIGIDSAGSFYGSAADQVNFSMPTSGADLVVNDGVNKIN